MTCINTLYSDFLIQIEEKKGMHIIDLKGSQVIRVGNSIWLTCVNQKQVFPRYGPNDYENMIVQILNCTSMNIVCKCYGYNNNLLNML